MFEVIYDSLWKDTRFSYRTVAWLMLI